MRFRFAKLGLANAMWSLIPIFPTWTIIPAVFAAELFSGKVLECETSYRLILFASIALTILTVVHYLNRLDYHLTKDEKRVKNSFRLFSFALYSLVNTAALILIIGVDLACNGDGQTLLACLYSGPLASLSLMLFGLLADLKVKTTTHNNT